LRYLDRLAATPVTPAQAYAAAQALAADSVPTAGTPTSSPRLVPAQERRECGIPELRARTSRPAPATPMLRALPAPGAGGAVPRR
jgi:hypothetical protein